MSSNSHPIAGCVVSACLLATVATPALALKYKVTDLGADNTIHALNDQGEAVGAAGLAITPSSGLAIYWPATGAAKTFPCPSGPASTASVLVTTAGPSDSGDVIVACAYHVSWNGGGDYQQVFRWNVRTDQSAALPNQSHTARLVTKNGLMVEGVYPIKVDDLQTGETFAIDSTTSGFDSTTTYSEVVAANQAGDLYVSGIKAGTATSGGSKREVELWRPGQSVKKLFGSTLFYSEPVVAGVSANGLVTGSATSPTSSSVTKPYVWSPKIGYLGLPASFNPMGVTDGFQVIGMSGQEPALWRPLLGTQKLATLLDAGSKVYSITRPLFINAKGQIAAYANSSADGKLHSVLLTPTP